MRDGVTTEPLRVFAPGFGAGAVAGYAVMRVDPAVVAVQRPGERETGELQADTPAPPDRAPASEEMQTAFG